MNRDEEIFSVVRLLPAAERAAYLDRECTGDSALRHRIVELLAGYEEAQRAFAAPFVTRGRDALEETTGHRIGRYKLLQKIGEGGCGVVWMAEQEEPVRRRVALKVIKLGMDTKAVIARFEAERQALAMMDHPNIARVYDAGATDTGRPFFVMELVRGISITKYCDENCLTPTQRLELFVKVCHAVQHAHQKGIIHRDLKPSNILITLNDGAPHPKIIDFGVAKATQGRLTDSTLFTAFEQFIGTPVYMSPEQAELSSLDVDTRSDIYSLGVLLYELLTGQPPFDPKSFAKAAVEEIRHRIREDEPPKPSTRWRTLGDAERTTLARLRNTQPSRLSIMLRGDLDWIVMRCMEKDRTRRYDTASALAADIEHHLRHEPVVARPPRTGYLVRKWIRRHRVGFAAGTAIAVVLVLGVVASTWQTWRAMRAERAALAAQRRAEAQELAARQRNYATDMNLAQQELAAENVEFVRERLRRHVPAAGQRDLRGWEWRYLWQASRDDPGENEVLGVRSPLPWSLAASRDGNWLAVGRFWFQGLRGGAVSVWDVRRQQQTNIPIGDAQTMVAFSPGGPVLAMSGYLENEPGRSWIELRNLATGRTEQRLELGEKCAAFKFSQDGETLFTATFSDTRQTSNRWLTIAQWRTRDGHKLTSCPAAETTLPSDHSYPFAFSSDFKFAAYPTENAKEFRVVDLDTGSERWRAKLDGLSRALAFSPDAKLLASGTHHGGIRLWDAATGSEVARFDGQIGSVTSLAFWPDGKMLASGGNRSLRLWDVPGRRALRTHHTPVFRLEVLEGPGLLVTGDANGTIRLWNPLAPDKREGAAKMIGEVTGWQFAQDSRSVFTIHEDGCVAEWAIPGFQRKREIRIDEPASLRKSRDLRRDRRDSALFAPDRPLVAVGSDDGIVWVLDYEKRSLVAEIKAASGYVWPVCFFDDGNRLIIYNQKARPPVYHVWHLARGMEIASWPADHGYRFAITPDEKQAIWLDSGGKGLIHDLFAGTSRPVGLSIENAVAVAISADARLLAVTGMAADSKVAYVKLWRYPSLQEVANFSGISHSLRSVAFSPDGTRLAAGGRIDQQRGEALRIWDIESHEAVLSLREGEGMFWETAFSPDGTVLGVRNMSGDLHLWRAPSLEEIEAAENASPRGAR